MYLYVQLVFTLLYTPWPQKGQQDAKVKPELSVFIDKRKVRISIHALHSYKSDQVHTKPYLGQNKCTIGK